MRFELKRYSIEIIPETEQDEAYLEEVLGFRAAGNTAIAKRVDAIGLSAWAYVEIKKQEKLFEGSTGGASTSCTLPEGTTLKLT